MKLGTIKALLEAVTAYFQYRTQRGSYTMWQDSIRTEGELHEAIVAKVRARADSVVVIALRRRLSIQQRVSAAFERRLGIEPGDA